MESTYKSKVGKEMIIITVGFPCLLMILFFALKLWIGAVILFVLSIITVYLLFTTKYIISDDKKTVTAYCLWKFKPINIENIKWIKETKSILSSPAASIDRLEIRYGKYNSILVSPRDKEAFIHHLLSINPQIEIKIK